MCYKMYVLSNKEIELNCSSKYMSIVKKHLEPFHKTAYDQPQGRYFGMISRNVTKLRFIKRRKSTTD